jgi:hypothetical protein
MARPGTAARQDKESKLTPATVLSDDNTYVMVGDKKEKGDLIVNESCLAVEVFHRGFAKATVRRVPLVYWKDVESIELLTNTSMHQFAGSGHTVEKVALQVVKTDGTSRTYNLTCSATTARNVLGKLGNKV